MLALFLLFLFAFIFFSLITHFYFSLLENDLRRIACPYHLFLSLLKISSALPLLNVHGFYYITEFMDFHSSSHQDARGGSTNSWTKSPPDVRMDELLEETFPRTVTTGPRMAILR